MVQRRRPRRAHRKEGVVGGGRGRGGSGRVLRAVPPPRPTRTWQSAAVAAVAAGRAYETRARAHAQRACRAVVAGAGDVSRDVAGGARWGSPRPLTRRRVSCRCGAVGGGGGWWRSRASAGAAKSCSQMGKWEKGWTYFLQGGPDFQLGSSFSDESVSCGTAGPRGRTNLHAHGTVTVSTAPPPLPHRA